MGCDCGQPTGIFKAPTPSGVVPPGQTNVQPGQGLAAPSNGATRGGARRFQAPPPASTA